MRYFLVKWHNTHSIACIVGIVLSIADVTPRVSLAASQVSNRSTPARLPDGAAYEAPSWMKARRDEERSQAAWQAEVRAAAAQPAAPRSKVRAPDTSGAERFLPNESPASAHPVVVLPLGEDPSVEALRLQAREEAVERARLHKAAAQGRHARGGACGRAERQRLEAAKQSRRDDQGRQEAAQQSRRDDEARLEAAQQSRRQDEARLEAAQQSRRQDEARLEAAQQSRRQDEARLEAAEAERRRQH